MLGEISRLVISALLIILAGFLYWCGFHSMDADFKLGATNIASVILTANVTYWLRPSGEKESKG